MMPENQPKIAPGLPNGIKRVNVGCGPHSLLNDWWNVDLREFPGIDQTFDATQPWPFGDCLDYVYAEHFLEHLSFTQAVQFLDQARHALAGQGRIRLSTPSLEWVLKTHFTFPGDRQATIEQTWAINRAFHGWGHQFLYSREVLQELLASRGFSDIRFFEYGKSDDRELSALERHGGYSVIAGYPSVWIVEAVKVPAAKPDDAFAERGREAFSRHVSAGH